jgi:hypothetical protein
MSVRNQTIKSLTDVFPDELPDLEPLPAPTADKSTGIFSFLSSIEWTTWLIIILILALLGINVFVYLAKGTQAAAYIVDNIFGPVLRWLGYNVVETAKTTVEVGVAGTKAAVDIVSGTATGAVTGAISGAAAGVQKARKEAEPTANPARGSHDGVPVQDTVQQQGSQISWNNDNLDKALSNAQYGGDVHPDDSLSSIQGSSGKSGWCFIGEQTGIRSCAELGVNDQCMSGDVFPTRDICMNPNLRT